MLLDQEWNIFLYYIFREANCMTNVIAKRGREHQYSVREYNKCLGKICMCYFVIRHSREYPVYNTCNVAT